MDNFEKRRLMAERNAKKLKESKAKARAEKRQKKKEVVKEETPETTE